MSGLRDFFRREQQLAALRSELAETRAELAKQRIQNERMREGMRRCLSCEYRREAIGERAQGKPGSESDTRP
jgi:cell division protein FtsB